jgi:hypothetical protein
LEILRRESRTGSGSWQRGGADAGHRASPVPHRSANATLPLEALQAVVGQVPDSDRRSIDLTGLDVAFGAAQAGASGQLSGVRTGSLAELGLEPLLALLPEPHEEEVDRLPSSGRRSSSGRTDFISPMWSARRWPGRADFQV